jgi:hypothetical protein
MSGLLPRVAGSLKEGLGWWVRIAVVRGLMTPKTVFVKESVGKGTRGGHYVYVLEGRELVHISEYAVRKLPGKWEDEVCYEVPVDKVAEKALYCFSFSRSGNAFLIKCRVEGFEDGFPKRYEYHDVLERRIEELRGLRFRVRNPELRSLLAQFEQIFISMIGEVKDYERAKGFQVYFMGRERRLESAFRRPDVYYFEFMSLPSNEGRIRSLRVTRRWIYELWVLKALCEALGVSRFKAHEHEGKPFWWVEQGSDFSTTVGETPLGDLTFWLEFQPDRGAHLAGMFAGRRIPIRPDIVVAGGSFEYTKTFVSSGRGAELIVECKEDPFEEWRKDVEAQIIPYLEFFKPKKLIIASLEPVPDGVKRVLGGRGIEVADNVRPGSRGVEVLRELVRRALRA